MGHAVRAVDEAAGNAMRPAQALAMLAREAATGRRLKNVVRLAGGDAQAVRGEHVQAAAREGDPEALAVIDDFGRWVALGLSNLTNAFDPEMFVLGGGLASEQTCTSIRLSVGTASCSISQICARCRVSSSPNGARLRALSEPPCSPVSPAPPAEM